MIDHRSLFAFLVSVIVPRTPKPLEIDWNALSNRLDVSRGKGPVFQPVLHVLLAKSTSLVAAIDDVHFLSLSRSRMRQVPNVDLQNV